MKEEYDFSTAKRGAVVPTTGKTRITIRLDDDLLDWFRAQVRGGGSYQSLINAALREYMRTHDKMLEDTLRRVVREELTHTAAPDNDG